MYGIANFVPKNRTSMPDDFLNYAKQHSAMVVSGKDSISQYLYAVEAAVSGGFTPIYLRYNGYSLKDSILELPMRELAFQPERTITQREYDDELYSFRRRLLSRLKAAFIVDAQITENVIGLIDELRGVVSRDSITIVLADEEAVFVPATYAVPDCSRITQFTQEFQILSGKEKIVLACVITAGGEVDSALLKEGLTCDADNAIQTLLGRGVLFLNTDNNYFIPPVMLPYIENKLGRDMGSLVDPFLNRLWQAYQQKKYDKDYPALCQLGEMFSNAGRSASAQYYKKASSLLKAAGHIHEAKQQIKDYAKNIEAECGTDSYEYVAASVQTAINALLNAQVRPPDYAKIEDQLWTGIRFNALSDTKKKVELYKGIPLDYALARCFASSGQIAACEVLCMKLLQSADQTCLCYHFAGNAFVYCNIDDQKASEYALKAMNDLPPKSDAYEMCLLTLCSCKNVPSSDRIHLLKTFLAEGRDADRLLHRRAFLLTVLAETYIERAETESNGQSDDWQSALEANAEAIQLYQKWLPPLSSELYFDYKLQYKVAEQLRQFEDFQEKAYDIQAQAMEHILRYELQHKLSDDERTEKLLEFADTLILLNKNYGEAFSSLVSVLQIQTKDGAPTETIAATADKIALVSKMLT